jgi:hypothetical protein
MKMKFTFRWILGFHLRDYEEYGLVGCSAV